MDDYNQKQNPEGSISPETESAAETTASFENPDQNTQNQAQQFQPQPDNDQESWTPNQQQTNNQEPWAQNPGQPDNSQGPWEQNPGQPDNSQGPWEQNPGQAGNQAPWQQSPNYPTNPPPQVPYYPAPPQGYSYGQGGPMPQNNQYWQDSQPQPQPSQPNAPVNNMAVTSMVLGIASMIISCCCFPAGFIIGFALGMGGLVLSILSKKGKPFSGYAIAGLILSIFGICESLFIFGCYLLTAHMMQDPETAALFNEILRQYYNGN